MCALIVCVMRIFLKNDFGNKNGYCHVKWRHVSVPVMSARLAMVMYELRSNLFSLHGGGSHTKWTKAGKEKEKRKKLVISAELDRRGFAQKYSIVNIRLTTFTSALLIYKSSRVWKSPLTVIISMNLNLERKVRAVVVFCEKEEGKEKNLFRKWQITIVIITRH